MRGAQKILRGTHQHPDGDALGSVLALMHALRLQGKQVVAYVPDPAPDFFSFLPGIEELTYEKPDASEFDLIMVLDYTLLYRTHLEDEVLKHPKTICIDHHPDNPKQADINIVVPEAAATAQILFDFFEVMEIIHRFAKPVERNR